MQAARPFPVPHEILRASFASALNDRRYALPVQCLLHPQPLLSPSFRAAGEESLYNHFVMPTYRPSNLRPHRHSPGKCPRRPPWREVAGPACRRELRLSPRCITPPLPIPLNRAIHTPLFCPRMRFFARHFGLPLNDRAFTPLSALTIYILTRLSPASGFSPLSFPTGLTPFLPLLPFGVSPASPAR